MAIDKLMSTSCNSGHVLRDQAHYHQILMYLFTCYACHHMFGDCCSRVSLFSVVHQDSDWQDLWCQSLSHHYLCASAKSTWTKICNPNHKNGHQQWGHLSLNFRLKKHSSLGKIINNRLDWIDRHIKHCWTISQNVHTSIESSCGMRQSCKMAHQQSWMSWHVWTIWQWVRISCGHAAFSNMHWLRLRWWLRIYRWCESPSWFWAGTWGHGWEWQVVRYRESLWAGRGRTWGKPTGAEAKVASHKPWRSHNAVWRNQRWKISQNANAEKICGLGCNGLSKHTKQLCEKKAQDRAPMHERAWNSWV